MDETLDALIERLHPRTLLSDFWDYVSKKSKDGGQELRRGAVVAAKAVGTQVKRHPLPAVLIASGIAWRIWEATRRDQSNPNGEHARRSSNAAGSASYAGSAYFGSDASLRSHALPETDEALIDKTKQKLAEAGGKIGSAAGKVKDAAQSAAASVGHGVSSAASAVSDGASRAGQGVKSTFQTIGHGMQSATHAAGAIAHGAGEAVHAVQQGATRAYESARDGVERATQSIRQGVVSGSHAVADAADQHPLALGAGCVAAGLAVGLVLPRTRREDRWLGETGDEWKDQALQTGERVMVRGRHVLEETAHAALDAAEHEGLSVTELGRKARNVAGETARRFEDAAQREGLIPTSSQDDAQQSSQDREHSPTGSADENAPGTQPSPPPPAT